MKYVVIALLFSVTTTLSLPGQLGGNAAVNDSNSSNLKDDIVINNVTEHIPNVTDVTMVPSPGPITTSPPPTSSTLIPTTTVTPNPPPTPPAPPTTITPNSTTTDAPTTTLKPTITPEPTPTTKVPTTTKATTTLPPHSSVKPIDPTTAAPSHHDRKFDGPSFVGGIVLALGLVAIGFVAFKFYKARTESNYHTL